MSFYRTDDPEVIAALADYDSQYNALKTAARAFGELFGGLGLVSHSITSCTFGGVKFKPKQPTDIWTTPDKNGLQRPRGVPRAGTTPERKQELKSLRETWAARLPSLRADPAKFYESLGTNWGQLMFAGMSYFQDGSVLYVNTTAKLNDRMVEILGSEFHLAKEKLAVAA